MIKSNQCVCDHTCKRAETTSRILLDWNMSHFNLEAVLRNFRAAWGLVKFTKAYPLFILDLQSMKTIIQ